MYIHTHVSVHVYIRMCSNKQHPYTRTPTTSNDHVIMSYFNERMGL